MYFVLKTIISALIIVLVSEIAKKSSFLAAIIISIPLTSILAFIWLYWDTKDSQKVIDLSYGTIVMTIPSFVFFFNIPINDKIKTKFYFFINYFNNYNDYNLFNIYIHFKKDGFKFFDIIKLCF